MVVVVVVVVVGLISCIFVFKPVLEGLEVYNVLVVGLNCAEEECMLSIVVAPDQSPQPRRELHFKH